MRAPDEFGSLILRVAARWLTPVVVFVSVYLLLRGHDAPGGGFIAALVMSTTVALRYLAHGSEGVQRMVRRRWEPLLAIGLLIAVGVGAAGYAIEGEFLSGTYWALSLPGLGPLKVTSSLGFDVGVFVVVLASVAAIIRALGREDL